MIYGKSIMTHLSKTEVDDRLYPDQHPKYLPDFCFQCLLILIFATCESFFFYRTFPEHFHWILCCGLFLVGILCRFSPWSKGPFSTTHSLNGNRISYHKIDHLIACTYERPLHLLGRNVDFIEKLLLQDLNKGFCYISAGIKLKSSTFQSIADCEKFLHDLFTIYQFIPVTVYTTLDNSISPSEISYHLITTKSIRKGNQRKLLANIHDLDTYLKLLKNLIQNSFSKMYFENLTAQEIARTIGSSSIDKSPCCPSEVLEIKNVVKRKLKPLTYFGVVNCLLILIFAFFFPQKASVQILAGFLILISSGYLARLWKTRMLLLNQSKLDLTFYKFNPYGSSPLDSKLPVLYFYDPSSNRIRSKLSYCFSLPHRLPPENWVNFTQNLLSELSKPLSSTSDPQTTAKPTESAETPVTPPIQDYQLSVQLEMRFHRESCKELRPFRRSLPKEVWSTFKYKPPADDDGDAKDFHKDTYGLGYLQKLSKQVKGYFSVKPTIHFTYQYPRQDLPVSRNYTSTDLSHSEKAEKPKISPKVVKAPESIEEVRLKQKLHQILQLMYASLNNTQIRPIRGTPALSLIIPNYHNRYLRGPGFVQLVTGKQLSTFITIPDDILNHIPIHYPSEFYQPVLHDQLKFGSVINCLSLQRHSWGGLSFTELQNGVLYTGDDYPVLTEAMKYLALLSFSQKHPLIIFDWENEWAAFPTHTQFANRKFELPILTPYENCGINLFDVPGNLSAVSYARYQRELGIALAHILQWTPEQLNLFRNVWTTFGPRTSVSLDSLKDSIGNTSEVPKNALFQQHAFETLAFLNRDFHSLWFSSPLDHYFDLEAWVSRPTSFIVNLRHIPSDDLKVVFIHSFLLQLSTVLESHPGAPAFKKPVGSGQFPIVFIPKASKVFPFHRDTPRDGVLLNVAHRLQRHGFGLVGATSSFHQLDRDLITQFQSLFSFKTTNPYALSVLIEKMNFDPQFPNSRPHSSSLARKRSSSSREVLSMQKQTLQSLLPQDCIVYRAKCRYPYLFRYSPYTGFIAIIQQRYDKAYPEGPLSSVRSSPRISSPLSPSSPSPSALSPSSQNSPLLQTSSSISSSSTSSSSIPFSSIPSSSLKLPSKDVIFNKFPLVYSPEELQFMESLEHNFALIRSYYFFIKSYFVGLNADLSLINAHFPSDSALGVSNPEPSPLLFLCWACIASNFYFFPSLCHILRQLEHRMGIYGEIDLYSFYYQCNPFLLDIVPDFSLNKEEILMYFNKIFRSLQKIDILRLIYPFERKRTGNYSVEFTPRGEQLLEEIKTLSPDHMRFFELQTSKDTLSQVLEILDRNLSDGALKSFSADDIFLLYPNLMKNPQSATPSSAINSSSSKGASPKDSAPQVFSTEIASTEVPSTNAFSPEAYSTNAFSPEISAAAADAFSREPSPPDVSLPDSLANSQIGGTSQ